VNGHAPVVLVAEDIGAQIVELDAKLRTLLIPSSPLASSIGH
jgi:hypothetical protein